MNCGMNPDRKSIQEKEKRLLQGREQLGSERKVHEKEFQVV